MEFPEFQFVPTTSSVNGHHWEKSCSMFLAPCCLPPLRNLSTFQWIRSHSGYPHIQWIRSHWAFYSPSWTGSPAAVSIFLFQFVQPRVSPAIMPWFPACWAGQSLSWEEVIFEKQPAFLDSSRAVLQVVVLSRCLKRAKAFFFFLSYTSLPHGDFSLHILNQFSLICRYEALLSISSLTDCIT